MDDMRLDPASNEPARQPEAVAASLIGQRDTANQPASTHRLVPPPLDQSQQCRRIWLQFLQRLALNAGNSAAQSRGQVVVPMSITSLRGMSWSISITPCGNTSRASSGKIRVKASACGKLIRRILGFRMNEWTADASGAPTTHTTSTLPSFIASTAADPAKGNNVAVSEFTPPLPRICSAEARVPLPTGPTAMRFPLSCDSRSNGSFEA